MNHARNIVFLALCLVLAACVPTPADNDTTAKQEAAKTKPAPSSATANPPDAPAGQGIAGAAAARPVLDVATLDHGQFRLSERRGRWVVVNFWATWCAPCRKEMPELDAYDAEHAEIEVIGLAYEEAAEEDMRAFLKRLPVKYPIALIDVYAPPTDFPTPRGLPMTYLIAPDGSVAAEFMGPVTAEMLDAAIAKHGKRA